MRPRRHGPVPRGRAGATSGLLALALALAACVDAPNGAGAGQGADAARPEADRPGGAPQAIDVDPSRPVLLVPGWFATGRDVSGLHARLVAVGWPEEWVRTVVFEDPTGGNREHADELHRAILGLLEATGADTVDIVAHSMGGLATRWYLLREDRAPVRRVAFLATPHRGTVSAHLAWGAGRDEMLPDSPFLDTLNAAPPVPAGVEAITIRTPIETHVIPPESGTLPGVPDFEVCCPTHDALPEDPATFILVRRFLLDGAEALPRGP